MRITARGWSRNMGSNEIGSIDVSEMQLSRDQNQTVYWNTPGLFSNYPSVEVGWGKELHLTGSYRVNIAFSRADIVRLFKATFGTELDVDLIEHHGFTVSPELSRAVLGKVKIADLTIGDLAALASKPAVEGTTEQKKDAVVRLLRKI